MPKCGECGYYTHDFRDRTESSAREGVCRRRGYSAFSIVDRSDPACEDFIDKRCPGFEKKEAEDE